jgi:hypothetical protein
MNKTTTKSDPLSDIKNNWMKANIKIALAADEALQDYQIKMTPAEAMEFVKHSGSFNRCCKSNLVRLLQRIEKFFPKYFGRPIHYFYIGNEGSRVIYAAFHKSSWQVEWNAKKDHNRIDTEMKRFAKEAHADEAMETPATFEYKFRFWWD